MNKKALMISGAIAAAIALVIFITPPLDVLLAPDGVNSAIPKPTTPYATQPTADNKAAQKAYQLAKKQYEKDLIAFQKCEQKQTVARQKALTAQRSYMQFDELCRRATSESSRERLCGKLPYYRDKVAATQGEFVKIECGAEPVEPELVVGSNVGNFL